MGRTILAVLVGLVSGVVGFVIVQAISQYSLEFNAVSQYATYKEYYDFQPLVLVVEILATLIAAIIGMSAAGIIDKGKKVAGAVVGFLYLAFIIKTLITRIGEGVTPPLWFVVLEPLAIIAVGVLFYNLKIGNQVKEQ